LDEEDVLLIADVTLGAPPGVRDWGLLASAVQRPRSSTFGQDAYSGLFEKAAALLHSIASNHSLIDGNERTGWAASITFPDINGYQLAEPLDEDAAADFVLKVAQSLIDTPEAAETLRTFVELT
jgi:death-on-curing protein